MIRFLLLINVIFPILAMDTLPDTQKLMPQLISSIKEYKYEETEKLITNNQLLLIHTFDYSSECFYEKNMTLLHFAAHVGNDVAATMLIAACPSLLCSHTKDERTPLHCASNVRVAKILLKNDAPINAKDYRGRTPLFHFLFHEYYHNKDIATYLVKHGANVNAVQSDYCQETLLHKAMDKNISPWMAKFLLKHGANPELKDREGKTPFDYAQLYERKTELFKKIGIHFLQVSCPQDDPYVLLKEGATYFKQLIKKEVSNERKIAETTLVKLFYQCKQQEQRKPIFNTTNIKKITLLRDSSVNTPLYNKVYLLKYVTFLDLKKWIGLEGIEYVQHYFDEICHKAIQNIGAVWSVEFIASSYPFLFYYDQKTAFILLKYMIQTKESLDLLTQQKVDLTGTDEIGNSLLYYAILWNNSKAIAWLIQKKIDCSIKNNKDKTAIDYIQNNDSEDCQTSFYFSFHDRFLQKKLNKQNEKLIAPRYFCNNVFVFGKYRTLFFKVLNKRPEKCLFLLKRRTYLNYKDENNISPLVSLLQPWYNTSWEKIPPNTKYLIRLLLAYDAVVEKKTIEQIADNYLKELLQKTYKNQRCCICLDHSQCLSNMCCINRHPEFLCQTCYDILLPKQCPICRMELKTFFT